MSILNSKKRIHRRLVLELVHVLILNVILAMNEDEAFMNTLLRQHEAVAKFRKQQAAIQSQGPSDTTQAQMEVEGEDLQVEPFQRNKVGVEQIPLDEALAKASTVVAGGEIVSVQNGTVYFKDERTYHTNVGGQVYSSTAASLQKGERPILALGFLLLSVSDVFLTDLVVL